MPVLLLLLIFVIAFGGVCLLNGWVLSILWNWFFVPVLALPPLGVVQAIGIALVVTYLTNTTAPKEEADPWRPWAIAVLRPMVALGIGWIVKQAMP